MGFRNWWNKLKYWKIGAVIGALLGFLHNPLLIVVQDSNNLFGKFFDKEYNIFCHTLNLEWGEPCGFVYFFGGFLLFPLICGIIGGIVGWIAELIISKK